MKRKKENRLLRENRIYYLFTALLLLGIKLFYSRASSDQLLWILAPTARWVQLLSGIPFACQQGIGYVNHELRCVIAPSCSGIHFMLITIALLVFSFLHRLEASKVWLRMLWIAGSIACSFLITVFVNGLRIILAIYLPDFVLQINLVEKLFTWERLHTVIGTAVYFASLLIIYRLGEQASLKIASLYGLASEASGNPRNTLLKRYMFPLFWYFLITLGLPLLNRAYQKNTEKFSQYSMLILSVCGIICGIQVLLSLLLKRRRKAS